MESDAIAKKTVLLFDARQRPLHLGGGAFCIGALGLRVGNILLAEMEDPPAVPTTTEVTRAFFASCLADSHPFACFAQTSDDFASLG